jgi:hypothetical protein
MDTCVAPLLLCGPRTVARAPSGHAAVIGLFYELQRDSCGCSLLFQRLCSRKETLESGRVARGSRFHPLVCFEPNIGRRIAPRLCTEASNLSPSFRLFPGGQASIIFGWPETACLSRHSDLRTEMAGQTRRAQRGGYKATARNREYLRRWRRGESIGFTMTASLKAKGLIPRTSRKYKGRKIVSAKYNGGCSCTRRQR